ncbi:MAG: hypothetical protein KJO53_15525 [Eudoraea sp.]|nr:hypothetical protein [Eudoraea sp.]
MTTISNYNRTKITVCLTLLFLLFSTFAFTQDSLKTATKTLLEELKNYTQTYYYSKGQKQRAEKIAAFMEDAGTYFQKEIGFTPSTILYVLAPKDWKQFAAKQHQDVYGFPHDIDSRRLVIAAEDNAFWSSFLPAVGKLPKPLAEEVTKAYGSPDRSYSMMPFFDLLALHEIGHSYHSQAGLKMHRNWMRELFVNIMLHTYVAEKKPELLPALETFPNMVVGAGSAEYQYTSLEDFERMYATMGMGPKNYGWYQSKLHSAARDIYNDGGKEVLRSLWRALKKYQEVLTDEEFVTMLYNQAHPSVANVYTNWDKTN